jgi:hypothetical protein
LSIRRWGISYWALVPLFDLRFYFFDFVYLFTTSFMCEAIALNLIMNDGPADRLLTIAGKEP